MRTSVSTSLCTRLPQDLNSFDHLCCVSDSRPCSAKQLAASSSEVRKLEARRNLIDKWLLPELSNSDLDTIGCGYLCVANIIAIFVGYSVRLVPCLLGI